MRKNLAGILGTGLIGGSVGLGLANTGWEVVGWDPHPAALQVALERGAVARSVASEDALLSEALDLLVLAGPLGTIPATLRRLQTGVLVTDVAGVKAPTVAAGAHLPHFVSGHPMAGREVSGPEAATPSLFRGASWIVIDDDADPTDMERLERIVIQLGAHPIRMSSREHDRTIAIVSHLPQLLASTLIADAAEEVDDLSLVGGSFRDLTRVAASDADMWSELLSANQQLVSETVRRFGHRLQRWAELLESGAKEEIGTALAKAALAQTGLHSSAGIIEVSLLDRPGELAAVGRALEHCGVDVRDIQLRHAPYGGGGLLQIFIKDDDIKTLREELDAEGLLVTPNGGKKQ
ncbi:MAG TPA: prephenate dehydrogenase/arogenate dehydrogenase family protein [Acidimicrobiia bacterium]|nr:prephenate dehydrogenase/arogenate dehydrogenase family protein [Acidimicrobiia bacterium]